MPSRHFLPMLAMLLLAGCGGGPETTDWRLEGPGTAPAGLARAFAQTADRHLRQVQVEGGLAAQDDGLSGRIGHPGQPVEAVASALRYALDDLDPRLGAAAKEWVLVLEYPDHRAPVRLAVPADR